MNNSTLSIPFYNSKAQDRSCVYYLEIEDDVLIDTILISTDVPDKSISLSMDEFKKIDKEIKEHFENQDDFNDKIVFNWGSGFVRIDYYGQTIEFIEESDGIMIDFYYSNDYQPMSDAINAISLVIKKD